MLVPEAILVYLPRSATIFQGLGVEHDVEIEGQTTYNKTSVRSYML